VKSTTNELSLAFRTNAYFVVPDTAFLATNRVTYHRFDSLIVSEANIALAILVGNVFVTLTFFCSCTDVITLTTSFWFHRYWKTTYFISVIFQILIQGKVN